VEGNVRSVARTRAGVCSFSEARPDLVVCGTQRAVPAATRPVLEGGFWGAVEQGGSEAVTRTSFSGYTEIPDDESQGNSAWDSQHGPPTTGHGDVFPPPTIFGPILPGDGIGWIDEEPPNERAIVRCALCDP
jgi:hypothetical protein